MNIHEMNLRAEPYRAIADGSKVIEMRLYDEKRQGLHVGDRIRFVSDTGSTAVLAEICALHRFPDFAALYTALIPRVGAIGLGYAPGDAVSPKDMLAYYTAEQIARYGVLGIEIKLCKESI